jgi:hypothetical protein
VADPVLAQLNRLIQSVADPLLSEILQDLVQISSEAQEGTWTPAIAFGGNSVGVTYGTAAGGYMLSTSALGSFAFITGTVILTNEGTSTGALTITGLPYALAGLAGSWVPVNVHIENFTTSTGSPQGKVAPGTNVIQMYQTKTGTASVMDNTNTTNTSVIIFSVYYRVS